MTNGDVVTSVRIVIGSAALKATKVYDNTFKHYCFAEAVYHDGVASKLNKAQVTVVMNQLSIAINTGEGLVKTTKEASPFGVPKSWLLNQYCNVKGKIHDYTA